MAQADAVRTRNRIIAVLFIGRVHDEGLRACGTGGCSPDIYFNSRTANAGSKEKSAVPAP